MGLFINTEKSKYVMYGKSCSDSVCTKKSHWKKIILSLYLDVMFQGAFWYLVSWNLCIVCSGNCKRS